MAGDISPVAMFYRIDRRHMMEETALVTGASGGIGAGIATVLAKQVRLVICVSQSLRKFAGSDSDPGGQEA